jgi:hypothetical protein
LEYVVGALAGILYGGLVGLCKYFFIWRPILSPKKDETVTMKKMYLGMFISYAVNVITLLITYFLRDIIPFDFVAFAIATAVALSVAGKAFSIHKVYRSTNTI